MHVNLKGKKWLDDCPVRKTRREGRSKRSVVLRVLGELGLTNDAYRVTCSGKSETEFEQLKIHKRRQAEVVPAAVIVNVVDAMKERPESIFTKFSQSKVSHRRGVTCHGDCQLRFVLPFDHLRLIFDHFALHCWRG